ncbi:hypothetical protein M3Y95_00604600 [Aphelenchoides besseyi]|nr:hypothetical protein M3Y95_00604600 [Aphelenchoides besseyi]
MDADKSSFFQELSHTIKFLLKFFYHWIVDSVRALLPTSWLHHKSLNGKLVLLTGAAGGIGTSLCHEFIRHGARLALWDVNSEDLEKLKSKLQKSGASVHTYVVDVGDKNKIYETIEQIRKECGEIDILFHNAGSSGNGHSFSANLKREVNDHALELSYRVNFLAHAHMVNAVLPTMLHRREGHIVATASGGGHIALSTLPDYTATKTALVAYMECLTDDLDAQQSNIKTTVISPTYVRTPFIRGFENKSWFTWMLEPDELARRVVEAIQINQKVLMMPWVFYIYHAIYKMAPFAVDFTFELMDSPICRICLDEENLDGLVEPCSCKGSIAHVHRTCLITWVNGSKKTKCEACTVFYPVRTQTRSFGHWKWPSFKKPIYVPTCCLKQKSLKGKLVLLTGANGGLGRSLALKFAQQGARLALWDINEQGLVALKEDPELANADVRVYKVDVSDKKNIYEAVERTRKECGEVDILFHNAGISMGYGFFDTQPESDDYEYELVLRVNFMALVHLVHAVLPSMLVQNDGHIVCTGSCLSHLALSSVPAYCASKHAIAGYMACLNGEMKTFGKNIQTTCVFPSYIRTPMIDGIQPRSPLAQMMEPDKVAEQAIQAIRLNQPVAFIPQSSYISYILYKLAPTPIQQFIMDEIADADAFRELRLKNSEKETVLLKA